MFYSVAPVPFYRSQIDGFFGEEGVIRPLMEPNVNEDRVENVIPQSDSTRRKTRTHFPETWLWDLIMIG